MADAADEADVLAEAERVAGMRRVRRLLAPSHLHECADCGDEIGLARRRALPSAVRCIGCQGEHERGMRG